jgi:hypothetical protein
VIALLSIGATITWIALIPQRRSGPVQGAAGSLTLPGDAPGFKVEENAVMSRKIIIRFGAGVVGAVLLLPCMALAGHYGQAGQTTVTTIIHSSNHHARGGPPAWAPAHGFRHRHGARHHNGRVYRQPVVVYYAPVQRPPVYRAPPTVYHAPSRHGTLDFSIHYRTRF